VSQGHEQGKHIKCICARGRCCADKTGKVHTVAQHHITLHNVVQCVVQDRLWALNLQATGCCLVPAATLNRVGLHAGECIVVCAATLHNITQYYVILYYIILYNVM